MLNLFQHLLCFSLWRHAEKFLFGIFSLAGSGLFFTFYSNLYFCLRAHFYVSITASKKAQERLE